MNIYKCIILSLEKLFKNDLILFLNNINERAITHKLACYLQEYFSEWDVDCEYNRNIDNIKHLKELNQNIYPDIIIHKRMLSNENLIIFEIKKSLNTQSDGKKDKKKIEIILKELKYKYGVFIRFKSGKDISLNQDKIILENIIEKIEIIENEEYEWKSMNLNQKV